MFVEIRSSERGNRSLQNIQLVPRYAGPSFRGKGMYQQRTKDDRSYPMSERQVEWRIDAASSRVIRLLIYGWIGLLGGGILLALGLVVLFAVGAAVAGEYALFGLILLLFLVGGPFSILYLWPAVRSGSFSPLSKFVFDAASDPAESLGERFARVFSLRDAIISIGLHLVAIPSLLLVEPRLLGGYVAVWFVLLILLSGFQTWGRIDPAETKFEYRSGTIPLAAVKRVRRHRVGGVVVCWLSYRSGAKTITTPSLVVLTDEAADALDAALDETEGEPPESTPSRTAPKVVAVGMGLGSVAFAAWFWLVVDIDPGMRLYLLVVFGGLGVFFTWVGLAYA